MAGLTRHGRAEPISGAAETGDSHKEGHCSDWMLLAILAYSFSGQEHSPQGAGSIQLCCQEAGRIVIRFQLTCRCIPYAKNSGRGLAFGHSEVRRRKRSVCEPADLSLRLREDNALRNTNKPSFSHLQNRKFII
jgi:hypothetical protein